MRAYVRMVSVFRTLFRRRALDADLDSELKSYLDLLAEEKIRSGLSEEEAYRQARLELGGAARVQERVRENRLGVPIDSVFRDVRFALRQLRHSPGFATAAILTLTLGIGASTAVFTVARAVLLKPLPYADPERLVTLWSQEDWPYGTNVAEYLDIRERQSSLTDIAAYTLTGANLAGAGEEPVRATVAVVTGGFFDILGVPPALGRTFGDEEDAPGESAVVVLRHAFWASQFGADPSIIGQSLALDDRPYTIIGVMPPPFVFPDETRGTWSAGSDPVQMWVPAGIDPARPGGRGGHGLPTVARLGPNVALEAASEEIRRISIGLHEEYPDAYPPDFRSGWTLGLKPLGDFVVRGARPALLMLLGAVGLLLLMACGNVANLLLARGKARDHEIAMRRALGAGEGRVVRQLLTESTLLSLLGGVAGLGLAYAALPWLLRVAPPDIPGLTDVRLDPRVLGFALAASIGTGLLAGLAPALFSAPGDLNRSLREGRTHSRGGDEARVRRALVTLQVAMTVVLLTGAGLLARSLSNLRSLDPGYRVENVLTFRVTLPRERYPGDEPRVAFFEELLRRLEGQPGVRAAGAISQLPLARDFSVALMAEGMPVNQPGFPHGLVGLSAPRGVSAGYLEAMGLTLLQGRVIDERDRSDAPLVALVSDEFARLAWSGEPAIGKRIAFATRSEPEWRTVIGVVADTREEAGKLASQRYRDAYFPLPQMPVNDAYVALHVGEGDPASLALSVRREVAALDADLPVHELRTMADVVRRASAGFDFNARLMGLFAAIALALAAVGVYGITSYSVGRRRRDMAVRVALGAPPRALLGRVVWGGMLPVLVGLALGLPGAFAITRLLGSLLYEVSPTDAWSWAGTLAVVGSGALIACYIPARRVLRVDPVTTLRQE